MTCIVAIAEEGAVCDTDRMAELRAELDATRDGLARTKADVDRLTAELDRLRAAIKRGFGQVLASTEHKG